MGVRLPVWLFACGLLLACGLIRIPNHNQEMTKARVVEVRTETRRFHFFYQRRNAALTNAVAPPDDSEGAQANEFDFARVNELIQDRSTWRDAPTWRLERR